MSTPTVRYMYCVVLVLSMHLTSIFTHTVDDVRQLVEDKTRSYDKKYRPVYDQANPVDIWIHFDLIAIQEFDEVAEKFSVIGYLTMGWHDELLQWKPEDYGNMTEFTAEGGDFWQPRLVLTNPHGNLAAVGNDWDIFRFSSKGIVSVTPGTVLDATCPVDTRKYPWDEQTCALVFAPWGYSSHEVNLVNITDIVGTTFYAGNGAWELISSNTSPIIDATGTSLIRFEMKLRRKSSFILINVMLPIFFMSFLNMLVFAIRTESGGRISYSVTLLLTIAVFLTLVGDNLPKLSDPMSSLSYFLLVILVISVCIVFVMVISERIYYRDENKSVPKCVEAVVRCLLCKRRKRNDFSQRNGSKYEQNPDFDPSEGDQNDKGVAVKRARSHLSHEEDNQVSWKEVSLVLDIICFVVFLCSAIAATILFFVAAMTKAVFNDNEE